MFDVFFRNADLMTRCSKATVCVATGAAAVWRAYAVLDRMSGMITMSMCVVFAVLMALIGLHIALGEGREQQHQG